jgi:hypothetical protein
MESVAKVQVRRLKCGVGQMTYINKVPDTNGGCLRVLRKESPWTDIRDMSTKTTLLSAKETNQCLLILSYRRAKTLQQFHRISLLSD